MWKDLVPVYLVRIMHMELPRPYLVVVLQAWSGDHLPLLRLDEPVQELFSPHL